MFIVIGDIHNLHMEILQEVIDKENPDFVLQVGDLGLYDEESDIKKLIPAKYRYEAEVLKFPKITDGEILLKVPVYFVLGNHDDYAMLQRYIELTSRGFKNLRVLNHNPIEIGGNKVCGLSGNYGYSSFEKNKRRKPNHILKGDMEKFTEPFNILVMHDRPHPETTQPLFDFIMWHKPQIVFHGHMHYKTETEIDGIKIYCLPMIATREYLKVDENLSLEWCNL